MSPRGGLSLYAAAALWGATVVGGFVSLLVYKAAPGTSAAAPAAWPSNPALPALANDRVTLVMLVHPKCTCSRASLAELRKLLAESHGKARAHVLFTVPEGLTPDFAEKSELWATAKSLPDTQVEVDLDGRKARQLGAGTSGHVVAYDASGRQLYSGGLTASRGHEGESPGGRQLLRLISGEAQNPATAPTFGCALRGSQEKKP